MALVYIHDIFMESDGNTPLHTVRSFAEAAQLVLHNPDGLAVTNSIGDLPLHSLLKDSFVDDERTRIIILFIRKHPDATRVKNGFGELPIHILLKYSFFTPSMLIVDELNRQNPEGIASVDGDGYSPRVYARRYSNPLRLLSTNSV